MPEQNDRRVTMRDLNEQLAKVPTRWEMRFWIIGALIAQSFIPVNEVAQAALRLL